MTLRLLLTTCVLFFALWAHAETFQPLASQPAQCDVSGDGIVSAAPGTFQQEGKAALVLTLREAPESCIVSGQIMLPAAKAAVKIALPAVEGEKAGLAGVASLLPSGKTISYGKKDEVEIENATDRWLPFRVTVTGGQAILRLPGGKQISGKASVAKGMTIALTGGTKVRDLKVSALPAGMQTLDIASKANAILVGKDATVGNFDPSAVPVGLQTVGGVPFEFFTSQKGQGLDVSTSMAGHGNGVVKGSRDAGTLNSYGRLCVSVSGAQYSAMHILAFSAGRKDYVPRITVRVGYFGGRSAILSDTVVNVPGLFPAMKEIPPGVADTLPVRLIGGKEGTIYHLRVPMDGTGNVREFGAYDIEFTRDVRVTGGGYGSVPAGLPSDVVILAVTMERSPVEMTYAASETGNVFPENKDKVFTFTLANRTDKPASGKAFVRYRGPGTGEETAVQPKEQEDSAAFALAPHEKKELPLTVHPKLRGWYSAVVGIEVDGKVVQHRDTSLAVLAPDTRKAFEDSPFGVWCFWRSHASRAPQNARELLASLMNKAGWRYTYGGGPTGRDDKDPAATFRQLRNDYRIIFTTQNLPNSYQRPPGWYDEAEFNKVMPPALAAFHTNGFDMHCKVLHESRSSNSLVRWVSPYFSGRPYPMGDAEKQRLDQQFENVKKYCLGIKKLDPTMKIVLINDYPAMAIEYLKRGFPKEAFDVIGLEGAMFERAPERQPDWLCLPGQIIQMRRAMKQYGYDKPIWMTEAMYHPSSPGALTEHEQGVIVVREAMLGLALGVERFSSAGGIVADASDDYYWSPWGSSGYCRRDPEYNPKPSYAAYAWMTQALDQARYDGFIETGSTALYVLRFRRTDGTCVYPIWTARGEQDVELKVSGSAAVLYDIFGNVLPVKREGGVIRLTAGDAPQYLSGVAVDSVASHTPKENQQPLGQLLLDFDDDKQVRQLDQVNKVLESSGEQPRFKGNFASSFETLDGSTLLKVTLKDDNNEYKVMPRYVEFAPGKRVVLPDRPLLLTARVKGNGSWGRIMFEMTDGTGNVWTSCGNLRGISSADVKGQSFFNFDGWYTIAMPVVGKFAGPDQKFTWPGSDNWWAGTVAVDPAEAIQHEAAIREYMKNKGSEGAAAALAKLTPELQAALKAYLEPSEDYPRGPLTLTKIIVDIRPHVLYVNTERPVVDRSIYVDKIGVIEAPADY